MKCHCNYDWRCDPAARYLVAGLIESAFTTSCLIFRKTEWVEDCGFIVYEKLVEIPRRYEGKAAKVRCFTKCLKYLDSGFSNDIATKNESMMREYLLSEGERP